MKDRVTALWGGSSLRAEPVRQLGGPRHIGLIEGPDGTKESALSEGRASRTGHGRVVREGPSRMRPDAPPLERAPRLRVGTPIARWEPAEELHGAVSGGLRARPIDLAGGLGGLHQQRYLVLGDLRETPAHRQDLRLPTPARLIPALVA